jgi:hypothetical protein
MTNIRALTDDELPQHYRSRPASDIQRVFGHNAPLFDAWNGFYRNIMRDGTVAMRIKELMRLRIAQLNECRL